MAVEKEWRVYDVWQNLEYGIGLNGEGPHIIDSKTDHPGKARFSGRLLFNNGLFRGGDHAEVTEMEIASDKSGKLLRLRVSPLVVRQADGQQVTVLIPILF